MARRPKTREVTFSLPGRELRLLQVTNLEELFDDPNDEDQVPCWAEVWPAAEALALYIWHNLNIRGETLLELGTGLGLPGLVAALKGARATLSDYQAQALELVRANAALNGIPGVETLLADWRDFGENRQFDWILASDVLYDPKFFPDLLGVMRRNLKPGGRVLVAHPGRVHTYEFLSLLRGELPVTSEEEALREVFSDDPHFPYHRIRIHTLRRALP